jgi:imidazole glycerol-phosphate synthase subunit HisH
MSPASAIAILDYGMGNLRSVEKALARVGVAAHVTADPAAARQASGLILPGVGAFPKAMTRVRELGFDGLIAERVSAGAPVLGICLGLQLLFERSSENEGGTGLGMLAGEVTPLDAGGLKVPHMGWEPMRLERDSDLLDGVEDDTPFYFVHSFAVHPREHAAVIGSAEWGERFVCAVERPPIYGVQFHPEKSSDAGLRLLANFARIAGALEPGGRPEPRGLAGLR